MKTSPLLMSADNPDGWKLEDLIFKVIDEIEQKNLRIAADPSRVAQLVLSQNESIIGSLRWALECQKVTLAALATVGPDKGPAGPPRIGRGSENYQPGDPT